MPDQTLLTIIFTYREGRFLLTGCDEEKTLFMFRFSPMRQDSILYINTLVCRRRKLGEGFNKIKIGNDCEKQED